MSAPVTGSTPHHVVTVCAVADLTPRMRRIRLTGRSLCGLQPRPAQDVELVLREPGARPVRRRYTIRNFGGDAFDIDVLLHGRGPGAHWAQAVQAGQTVEFRGPRGRLELAATDWHLFLGDEAALPAIAELIDAVPAGQKAVALIEVGDRSDELPLSPTADVRYLYRQSTPPGSDLVLGSALDAWPPPVGRGHAYVLGESRVVVALRARLARIGLDQAQMYLKGYWNVGRQHRQP